MVSSVLVEHESGDESRTQDPGKNAVCGGTLVPSAGEEETGGFLRLTG